MVAACLTMTVSAFAQTPDASAEGSQNEKKGFYVKLGGSYFFQATANEFPIVGGQEPNRDVYDPTTGALISREAITGSFGEGFRTGLTGGYRFTERLGFEMGLNYYLSDSKTMAQTTNRVINTDPTYLNFTSRGRVKALDLSPSMVLYLGETKGFEPYTKVGVILPINGRLEIETDMVRTHQPSGTVTNIHRKDIVKPNPTVGFMAALGTSYKLGNKLSAFAELEYRNFTVHGKTKETTEYTVNGSNQLGTLTTAQIHTDYVDVINTSSNNPTTNQAGFDPNKPLEELSSYISISGVGLTLGLRYDL